MLSAPLPSTSQLDAREGTKNDRALRLETVWLSPGVPAEERRELALKKTEAVWLVFGSSVSPVRGPWVGRRALIES